MFRQEAGERKGTEFMLHGNGPSRRQRRKNGRSRSPLGAGGPGVRPYFAPGVSKRRQVLAPLLYNAQVEAIREGVCRVCRPEIFKRRGEVSEAGVFFYSCGSLLSPAVINYCLRTTHLNKHLNGLRFLLQACLLGAPNGNTIETFLAEKSKDERRQGRALLCYLEAISVNDSWAACELMKRFCGYQPAFKKGEGFTLHLEERLEKFALNIQDALKSLRGKSSNNNKVDFYWGRSCVREIIKKYKDGKCSYEQMYDLTFNIMVQRPRLQDAIVSFFQEFLGRAEAERWVSLRPSSLNATNIPISQPQKISNVYAPFDDPDALAIPITTRVTVVQRREELMAAIEALNEAAESEFPFAGVDAEWSAYVPDSKASVLQVALQNQIFIFDLDKLPPDQSRKLFENLFGNRALIKVGFQFGEDLTKLRKVVPRTVFLYAPQSLLCITSVIAQVAIISWENDDPMISEEFLKKKEKEKEKGKRREKEKEDDSKKPPAVKDVVFKLKSLGLAKLVKAMTGMSLDKSEQCSVWNRRPLRTAQIRYGALDVSCLLLMMSKCLSYAKKWNVEIFGLMKPFYLEPSAMPLFFCDDCDPNIFPRIVIKEVLDELDEE
ncbi:hypothetical protein L596_002843 [Steinernema carpocapsae]|uniref:3'-5' exonuclease domain-containing protein n=1 Tax=Steinernema carpocapsae TaxID=34508 RepID=A0A4U8UTC5_STECR|nr:hypothetical protein L596_002843 [Steinernema carpocapsae]